MEDEKRTSMRRTPTPMPEWVEKQFGNAEKTVQQWPESKRKAAGIPIPIEPDTTVDPDIDARQTMKAPTVRLLEESISETVKQSDGLSYAGLRAKFPEVAAELFNRALVIAMRYGLITITEGKYVERVDISLKRVEGSASP